MLLIRLLYQSYLPYSVRIGPDVSFGHRQGIFIARGASIGAHCKIRHQVTFVNGAKGAAIVGDDVKIGCGAKLIGNVRVGSRVQIGANAVVVDDVPDDATVVGVPARVARLRGVAIDVAPR